MNTTTVWVMTALIAASLEPILVKIGYRYQVTPVELLIVKNLVAAAVALGVVRRIPRFRWTELQQLMGIGGLFLLTNLFTLQALTTLSAVVVITLATTTPALVALWNERRGKDRLDRSFWPGFVMAAVGVALTVGVARDMGSATLVGLAWMAGAVLTSSIYRVRLESLTEKYAAVEVSTYIFCENAGAAVVLFMLHPSVPWAAVPVGVWTGIAAAAANLAFVAAVGAVGATRMSIFVLLQRPLIVLTAAWVLREPLDWVSVLGIALVLAGVRLAKVTRVRSAAQPVQPVLVAVETSGAALSR